MSLSGKIRKGLWLSAALFFATGISAKASDPGALFDSLSKDEQKLRKVLAEFPKGGELHLHLQGALTPEELTGLAHGHGFLIDPGSLKAHPPDTREREGLRLLDTLMQDAKSRRELFRSWSVLDFQGKSGFEHFFGAFGRYKAITGAYKREMTATILRNLGKVNGSYLELMANPSTPKIKNLVSRLDTLCPSLKLVSIKDFVACLNRNGLAQELPAIKSALNEEQAWLKKELGYDPFDAFNKKGPVLRYLYQAPRGVRPEEVMTILYTAFMLVDADIRFRGVNLVQPENTGKGQEDYLLHMKMVGFLKEQFPKTPVTLHAGEVGPESENHARARTHIREAVELAGASRIGHGVNILSDPSSESLLKLMAERKILVEVNLSSNDFILGVKGKEHPLNLYRKMAVPVALSTDDPGILLTDMNQEMFRAVSEHGLSLTDLKKIVRDSLTYSFLEGDSLFAADGKTEAACTKGFSQKICQDFLAKNSRAFLQEKLETDLKTFDGFLRKFSADETPVKD